MVTPLSTHDAPDFDQDAVEIIIVREGAEIERCRLARVHVAEDNAAAPRRIGPPEDADTDQVNGHG